MLTKMTESSTLICGQKRWVGVSIIIASNILLEIGETNFACVHCMHAGLCRIWVYPHPMIHMCIWIRGVDFKKRRVKNDKHCL